MDIEPKLEMYGLDEPDHNSNIGLNNSSQEDEDEHRDEGVDEVGIYPRPRRAANNVISLRTQVDRVVHHNPQSLRRVGRAVDYSDDVPQMEVSPVTYRRQSSSGPERGSSFLCGSAKFFMFLKSAQILLDYKELCFHSPILSF